uniref:Uncharacterized protein n=1 Tax=Meloidogyne javanica TaxID=6303 RepID=A0A915MI56_MELJA
MPKPRKPKYRVVGASAESVALNRTPPYQQFYKKGTPPAEDKKNAPGEEGDKKKKGGSSAKKEKGKGAAEKGKEDGKAAAKALVTAMGPMTPPPTPAGDPLKTMFDAQQMQQLHNIAPGMIPVFVPAATPGGSPTVFMMPSKDMQSVAALTAQPAMTAPVVAKPSPAKAPQKEPSLYEAIEISKRSIGKKNDGKGNNKSKKLKGEATKQGMADQGSYQTLADIDANKLFQKK